MTPRRTDTNQRLIEDALRRELAEREKEINDLRLELSVKDDLLRKAGIVR